MVNVMLIGHGGREHAIAEALKRGGATLSAYMGKENPAIYDMCEGRAKVDTLDNFEGMVEFAQQNLVNFVVVGPEAPLANGITNALQAKDLKVVGPTVECAQLESSKIFTRNLMKKYEISSNPKFKEFSSMEGLEEYIDEVGKEDVVVKPDGLTGGKGVKVWGDHLNSKQEILDYCQKILDNKGKFIIEEKLDGEEFTYICFVDGKKLVGTPLVQDNKRAYEGDKGPNTGGMGSYSMADHLMPFFTKEDVEYAHSEMQEVINAVAKETGEEYKGVLYGQFMKTKKGIKLVEFNIRFGDPEAMNVLPIMKDNFVEVCQEILEGNLRDNIEFEKKATVVKYCVPDGYPVDPQSDEEVIIDKEALDEIGARIYYASVYRKNEKIYTTTSRAIALVGIADSLEEAEKIAEKGTSIVKGKLFHRTDVGSQALLDERAKHMEELLKD